MCLPFKTTLYLVRLKSKGRLRPLPGKQRKLIKKSESITLHKHIINTVNFFIFTISTSDFCFNSLTIRESVHFFRRSPLRPSVLVATRRTDPRTVVNRTVHGFVKVPEKAYRSKKALGAYNENVSLFKSFVKIHVDRPRGER